MAAPPRHAVGSANGHAAGGRPGRFEDHAPGRHTGHPRVERRRRLSRDAGAGPWRHLLRTPAIGQPPARHGCGASHSTRQQLPLSGSGIASRSHSDRMRACSHTPLTASLRGSSMPCTSGARGVVSGSASSR